MLDTFHEFIKVVNSYVWGPPMLILLFGTHLYFTIRLKFIQRYTWKGIKLSFTKDPEAEGDISQWDSLSTALAATIGTGNIVGVATGIALGGPGALLWLWLTGVFGISTKYAEAILSVKYRQKTSDGTMLGGPMYALEKGLGMKWLAVTFCAFTAIAAFGIGNMVQANSLTGVVQATFNIPPYITGIFITVLVGCVILGGVKSIAKVCGWLVPVMAIFYSLGCIIIIVINYQYIVPAMSLMFSAAFTPSAAGGGFIGASVMMAARFGVARGLFSNESGLGSAPIVAAAAQTRNSVRQGLVSMTGTFWDTVVGCALTGIVLLTTIMRSPEGFEGLQGAALTSRAFDQIPVLGPIILTVGMLTFAFATILGWSYYGERAAEYLFGKIAIKPYRVFWVIACMLGSVASLSFVWDLSDTMNALMALPNLVTLLLLSKVIVKESQDYLWTDNLDKYAPVEQDYSMKG